MAADFIGSRHRNLLTGLVRPKRCQVGCGDCAGRGHLPNDPGDVRGFSDTRFDADDGEQRRRNAICAGAGLQPCSAGA